MKEMKGERAKQSLTEKTVNRKKRVRQKIFFRYFGFFWFSISLSLSFSFTFPLFLSSSFSRSLFLQLLPKIEKGIVWEDFQFEKKKERMEEEEEESIQSVYFGCQMIILISFLISFSFFLLLYFSF